MIGSAVITAGTFIANEAVGVASTFRPPTFRPMVQVSREYGSNATKLHKSDAGHSSLNRVSTTSYLRAFTQSIQRYFHTPGHRTAWRLGVSFLLWRVLAACASLSIVSFHLSCSLLLSYTICSALLAHMGATSALALLLLSKHPS